MVSYRESLRFSQQPSFPLYLPGWFKPKTLPIVESAWDFVFFASNISILLFPCSARCLGKMILQPLRQFHFFLGHSLSSNFWKQTDFALPKSGLDDYWIPFYVSPRWLCQMTKRGFFSLRVCPTLLLEAEGLDQMPVLDALPG